MGFSSISKQVRLGNADSKMFLADLAHQAVFMKEITNDIKENTVINEMVREFRGEPLIGPKCLALTSNSEKLYFSDSGPFGESTLQEKKVFGL